MRLGPDGADSMHDVHVPDIAASTSFVSGHIVCGCHFGGDTTLADFCLSPRARQFFSVF